MKMRSKILTYSELIKINSFEGRYDYLRIGGSVGEDTFGFDRYLNQEFYTSLEWRRIRDYVITRDIGCDMGLQEKDEFGNLIYEIHGKIIIHHLNPLTKDDIIYKTKYLLDPEYLVCVSYNTHQAIHYGNKELLMINQKPITRIKNDTCPWRH